MAVPARVAAETSFTVNAATPSNVSRAYTCAVNPGSDRLLVAFIATRNDTFPSAVVAYNGVTMSIAAARVYTGSAPDRGVRIYYLLNADIPNDGASHNFTIDNYCDFVKTLLVEYINVAQAAPEDTDNVLLTSGGASLTLTASVDALLLDFWFSTDVTAVTPITFGTNQNKLAEHTTGSGSAACSDKLPAGHSGGSVDMSVTSLATGAGPYCAVAWAPAAAAAAVGMIYPPRGRYFQHMLVR
jgi:hypothetical protein